jgi:hypothetical protein
VIQEVSDFILIKKPIAKAIDLTKANFFVKPIFSPNSNSFIPKDFYALCDKYLLIKSPTC